ncbi:2-hydroxychromene-2-carboxylate isomerase [Sandaracinus amylolyticus]|uniref:2-hydroxychromene-2-carboxylate isomerase n=1 Tax=Sandaracinus amylolyticus TaxID=927083 RepID=A0A0F6W1F0_9BACT|nr:2-hydroxychromene-2-carboxylate isomerase [Sandaracinus amylolyticus]AKF05050.1 2-hydroxychromene-2-carboxylate isomerase [Sandaracinus amylolyticus]
MRFLFDFLSPYAYLAWSRIHGVAACAGREVEPVPVLFAGLLGAHGTRGPAEVDAKRRYLVRDVLRIASAWDVPIAAPRAIPFRSLTALRLTSIEMDRATRRALIDRLFAGAWARGEDLADSETLAAIAREVGLGDDALARAESSEVKASLRRVTDEAIAAGVFGVPTVLVDGEMFWGCDSFPHLERFLAGELAVDRDVLAAFDAAPVGARRSGA